MRHDALGEVVLSEQDLFDAVMQNRDPWQWRWATVEPGVDLEDLAQITAQPGLRSWHQACDDEQQRAAQDQIRCDTWYMPQEYRDADIAAIVLDLCSTPQELQRAGEELLMFQERGLFDVLRYLRYLVDTMRQHHIIWGVGRGSSVASFVLYLLGVHRIHSLHYDLDPREFLR